MYKKSLKRVFKGLFWFEIKVFRNEELKSGMSKVN